MHIDDTTNSLFTSLRALPATAMTRRSLLRGIAAVSAVAVAAANVPLVAGQEDMPMAATPEIGPRPDGSRLWRVQVAGGSMDDGIELMGFFPGEITINAGDAIFFDFSPGMPEVPHTVSFLAGQPIPDFVIPESTETAASGDARLMFNPAVAFPQGADAVDGSGIVSSGMDILLPPGTSYTLTFATPGTYDYVDLVFPMAATGKVIVLEQGAALPKTQEEYDQATLDAQTPLIERGRDLIAQFEQPSPTADGDGKNLWEVTAGVTDGTIEVAAFIPSRLEIEAGDTVRWTLEHSTLEVHTATFAGSEAPPELVLVEQEVDGPPKLILNPLLVAPAAGSIAPDAGLVNTGFMSTRFPFPPTAELTFDTPGEYTYYCPIHGSPTQGMRGTIVVS